MKMVNNRIIKILNLRSSAYLDYQVYDDTFRTVQQLAGSDLCKAY